MKYKLIKTYPGSPKLGHIDDLNKSGYNNQGEYVQSMYDKNPEFWEKVVEKDYEILSLVHKEQNRILLAKDANIDIFLECKQDYNYWSIHSIKRLSDGEIFTIGDIVNNGCNFNCEIKKLYINDNKLIVDMNLGGWQYINYIQKVKQKLFTSEDGVDIFEGDKFYTIDSNFEIQSIFGGEDEIDNAWCLKEKAEEYIIINKPCLSLKDINDYNVRRGKLISRLKLKELVKQKLNK